MKQYLACILAFVLVLGAFGCEQKLPSGKIGVSFGVGAATRWKKEQAFMENRARELGIDLEVAFDVSGSPDKQTADCLALINSGISVLIIVPRDVEKMGTILAYARQHNVKVITYARTVINSDVDLFIGYDCYQIGQSMGQHLTEKVYSGNIIILKGDEQDFNTSLLYHGGMKYIAPLVKKGDLTVILDDFVPKWSPAEAQTMVQQALAKNNNQVDAIFASNDALAGGAAKALKEAGATSHVVITGMDAELAALRRITEGQQDMTIYLDLKDMAYTAIEQAANILRKQKVSINSILDLSESTKEAKGGKLNAYLINGKIVTRENMDKLIVEPGIYTRETIYNAPPAP